MSIQQGSTTASVENRNADVIAGLREAADFLEAHLDLPGFNAHIGAYPYGTESRTKLTAVAEALGTLAQERIENDRVRIEAKFAELVTLSASAEVRYLGGTVPVRPKYEPIIARTDGES